MGFFAKLCCASTDDEVHSDPVNHPDKQQPEKTCEASIRSIENPSSSGNLRHNETESLNNSLNPSNDQDPDPLTLEENFGRQHLITDDIINKQLRRLDTNTDRSTTEEDRWFERA